MILAYLAAITSLRWRALLLLQPWPGEAGVPLAELLASVGYMAIGLLQFFAGQPRWSILWRTGVAMRAYLVGYAAVLQVVGWTLYGLRRSGLMAAPA